MIDAEGTGAGRRPDRPVAVSGRIGAQPRHPTVRIDGGGKGKGVAGQRTQVGEAVRPRAGGRPDDGAVDGAVHRGGVSRNLAGVVQGKGVAVMLYDPEPVGVQTTAWLMPWGAEENPAMTPAALMSLAVLVSSPGSVPRSVIR